MRICQFLMIAAFLVSSSAVAAAKSANRQAQERVAKKACATGDYQKGIDILADLYISFDDQNYIYNQARCYEQNGHPAQAIERFREYLRKTPNLTAIDRADVEKHILDCQGLVANPNPVPQPVAPAPIAPAPQLMVAMSSPVMPAPERTVTTSAPPAEPGSGLRVAGMVTAGAGALALATAVALNIKHESLVSQQNAPGGFSRSREADVKSYETWTWVGYGVGTAAILTGGSLWFLGRRSSDGAQSSASLLPIVDAHQAGCLLQGAF
jgi:tetratricopeptide (TPR) repeat protein